MATRRGVKGSINRGTKVPQQVMGVIELLLTLIKNVLVEELLDKLDPLGQLVLVSY